MPGRLPAQNTQPRQPWPAVETGADFGGAAVFGDGGWLFQRARALRLSGSGHRRDAGDAEAEARRGGGSGSHCGLCRSCAGRHGACGHVHQGRDVKWRRLCSCAHRPVQPGCHRRRHDDRAGRGNDRLKYSNRGATRNDPLDAKLVDAMSFLPIGHHDERHLRWAGGGGRGWITHWINPARSRHGC